MSEVTFIFWDLVLEDQVVAERVPCELSDRAVILVEIFATMGEDHIRLDA